MDGILSGVVSCFTEGSSGKSVIRLYSEVTVLVHWKLAAGRVAAGVALVSDVVFLFHGLELAGVVIISKALGLGVMPSRSCADVTWSMFLPAVQAHWLHQFGWTGYRFLVVSSTVITSGPKANPYFLR